MDAVWEPLNVIGTIAFAVSGTIIALEEKYDLFGVYVLGFVTAFGGGVIRNVLIDLPVSLLWKQDILLTVALLSITVFALFPFIFHRFKSWLIFFDAIGLAAFSIQGALYAKKMGHPVAAVVVAAVMTGIGGGVIRDVLAGRKPFVFQEEVYASWSILVGLVIGWGLIHAEWQYYLLFLLITLLRMISVYFRWNLPFKPIKL